MTETRERPLSERYVFRIPTSVAVFLLGFFLVAAAIQGAFPSGVSLERALRVSDGLSHDSILSLAVARDRLYIGTERNLTILGADGRMTIWGPKNSRLNLQRVPALAIRNGDLWATCRTPIEGGGTFRWDGNEWWWYEEIKDDMQSNFVSCFHVDASNTLWIGTENQGLNEFVFENNPFRKFGYLATKKGLIDNRIICLTSRPGELWIGTMKGLSVYRGKKGDEYLFTGYSPSNGFPAELVTALAVIGDRVYAGTSKGLQVLESGSWRTLTTADGLTDSWVKTLGTDGRDLWVGTSMGLQRFRDGVLSKPVDYRDGLPSSHIQCLAFGPGSDGIPRIYVGTDHGLAILRNQQESR